MSTRQRFALVFFISLIITAACGSVISQQATSGYPLFVLLILTVLSGLVALSTLICLLTKNPKKTLETVIDVLFTGFMP